MESPRLPGISAMREQRQMWLTPVAALTRATAPSWMRGDAAVVVTGHACRYDPGVHGLRASPA